jgi:hypothetical protein
MENLWVEVVKQVPSLAVLVWLVTYFLRHMQSMLGTFSEIVKGWSKTVEAVNADAQAFQNEIQAEHRGMMEKLGLTLDRNTEALGKNAAVLDRATKLLEGK